MTQINTDAKSMTLHVTNSKIEQVYLQIYYFIYKLQQYLQTPATIE